MLLTACAAQTGAHTVSVKVVESPENCKVLDHISSEAPLGTQKDHLREAAIANAKAHALKSGANAIYLEKTHSRLWGSTVLVSALRCIDSGSTQPAS